MKKYCTTCGSPTDYSLKLPLFCSNCGKSFDTNNISASKAQTKQIITKQNLEEDRYEDEDSDSEEVNYVPDILDLDIDLQVPQNKPVKLGSILGTSKDVESIQLSNVDNPNIKMSKKKILEEFAKEAGSIRKNKKGK
jgi:uncharacterized Zn finger protein (UPF0148 family)